MENVINFLMNNYFYFAGVAFVLILAFIGYMIDEKKTEKLKREFAELKEQEAIIPIKELDGNLKLGSVLNNQGNNVDESSIDNIAIAPVVENDGNIAPSVNIKKN